MLRIEDLHVFYGGIHAVKGLALDVPEGSIVGLIGPNGAGKSTTLRTICGIVRASEGRIVFGGQEILGRPAHEIVELGIAMVPEGRKIFPNLTVAENLLLGAHVRRSRDEVQRDLDAVYRLFPILKDRSSQGAGTLSGGEQQMLAVGRALMSKPRLLLMDEPSLGLAPKLVRQIFDIIVSIRAEGRTILLVEQNARAALRIADYCYVLESGRIVLQGTGQALLEKDEVRRAYLGA